MTTFWTAIAHGERPALSRIGACLARCGAAALLLSALAGGHRPAAAADALDKRIAVVAKNVAALLKAQQMNSISIGAFAGPPNFPTSSGPAIVQTFTDEFKKHEISVASRAPVGLSGDYSITEVDQFDPVNSKKVKHLAIRINGRLVDRFGAVITTFNDQGIQQGTFQETVAGADTVVETIGLPADLPAEKTSTEVDKILRDSLIKPTVVLTQNNTRYRASEKSPYEIEILVDGQPCPIQLIDDLPYVDIKKGQIYAIRVYNNSEYDAAVRLLIDGLSVFTFSEIRNPATGKPAYSVYIVGKGESPTLKGWHKTNSHVESFLVTDYSESAAARLGHTQDLGTITVTFSAAWPHGSTPPHDEDLFAAKGGAGGNVATGFGPRQTHKVEEVRNDIGRVRASLSIRYTK